MKKRILFVLAALLLAVQWVQAAPANPTPVSYRQPDSSEVTISLRGDEYLHWAVSTDGYTLLFGKDGYVEYAVHDSVGNLTLSGIRAHNEDIRSAEERSFLSALPKGLWYSASQTEAMRELRGTYQKATQKQQPLTRRVQPKDDPIVLPRKDKDVRIPLILVEFPDKPFTKTKQDFELLFNQLGYTMTPDSPITGSVRDYFLAASSGKMDFQVDVFGPYTMPENIAYYDQRNGGNSRKMAREAAQKASDDGCNLANYDTDGDGTLDGLHIIYAGNNQAVGAPVGESIYPHAHMDAVDLLTLGGKRIYSTVSYSPELSGSAGTALTHIDVIVHELGHSILMLPDFYDVDYPGSGGQSIHLGQWCIMATGGGDGKTPSFPSAWCRAQLGWVQEVVLDVPQHIVLPNPAVQDVVYRINTTTPGEYFLLENRQQQGWDSFSPGSGLLIYHVNENGQGWDNGCINCNPAQRGLYVKQAEGGMNSDDDQGNRFFGVESQDDVNKAAYPQEGHTSFTDETVPNSKSWVGNNTGKPITNIVHNTVRGTLSFDFMGFESVPVSGVNLNKIAATVAVGEVLSLEATVLPSNATNQNVHWSSSDSNVVRVNNADEGFIAAIAAGSATITAATQDGNYTASCVVTVNSIPTAVGSAELLPLTLYPNPAANGKLRIEGREIKEGEAVEIYSLSGVLALTLPTAGKETSINVSLLPSGTYIIKVGRYTAKFVKQ